MPLNQDCMSRHSNFLKIWFDEKGFHLKGASHNCDAPSSPIYQQYGSWKCLYSMCPHFNIQITKTSRQESSFFSDLTTCSSVCSNSHSHWNPSICIYGNIWLQTICIFFDCLGRSPLSVLDAPWYRIGVSPVWFHFPAPPATRYCSAHGLHHADGCLLAIGSRGCGGR